MVLILVVVQGSHLHQGFGGRSRVFGLRIQNIQIDDVIPDRVLPDPGSYSLTAEYSKKRSCLMMRAS